MHTPPANTHKVLVSSLLDLLWSLWVLAALEAQDAPEIAGCVNERHEEAQCEQLFMQTKWQSCVRTLTGSPAAPGRPLPPSTPTRP